MNLLRCNRQFLRLWLGQLVSQVGDKVFLMTLSWWVLVLTSDTTHPRGNPAMTGYIMAASVLPATLLGPLAGTLVDRFSRRTLMVVADLARASLLATLAYLAWDPWLSQQTHLLLIFPIAIAVSIFNTLFNPAVQATTGSIVAEADLKQALALQSMARDGSNLLGAVLGGALVAAVGVTVGFGLNAASYLFSALMVFTMTIPQQRQQKPMKEMMGEGWNFVRQNPTVRGLILLFGIGNFFMVPALLLLPTVARVSLHGTPATLGAMEAATAIGSISAAVLLMPRLRSAWLPLLLGLFGNAVAILTLGLVAHFPSVLAAVFGLGAGMALVSISIQVLLQNIIPDPLKGRVFALVATLAGATFPVAALLVGFFTTYLTVAHTLVLCGMGNGICALGALFIPGLRQSHKPGPTTPG